MLMDVPLIIAIPPILVGLMFCRLGWQAVEQVQRFRRDGQRLAGHVVDIREVRYGQKQAASYLPVFAVGLAAGRRVELPNMVASTGYNFEIGSRHDILVLDGEDEVLLADAHGGRILGYGCLLLGAVALALGCLGLLGHLTSG